MGTDRLVLRPSCKEAIPALTKLSNNWNVVQMMGLPHPISEEFYKKKLDLADDPDKRFVIMTPQDGVIGLMHIAICGPNNAALFGHKVSIGYWLGEPFWGRGYATEAVRAVTDYAFRELGVSRIEATAYSTNIGSCKVLEKAGFLKEGIQRNGIMVRTKTATPEPPKFADVVLYGLLKSDKPETRGLSHMTQAGAAPWPFGPPPAKKA